MTFPLRDKQDLGFPIPAAQKRVLLRAKRSLKRQIQARPRGSRALALPLSLIRLAGCEPRLKSSKERKSSNYYGI